PPHLSPLGHLTAVSLAIPALIGDLSHNNVNIFIFFLVAGCLECCRRHCDVAAGLSLALAISCKLTPLLFVPYFLWKKAWRLLLGCGVGLGLWLLVIPAGVFGWERNSQLLTDWYRLMVVRPLIKGEITSEHPNQSLVGWTYRLFTDSPSFVRYVPTVEGDMPVPAAYHNVIHLPANVVWILTKVYGVTFVLLMMLLCRTPDAERSGWRRLAEYAWIILGMLLLSERTWKHHAVTLVIPGVALAAAFANGVGTPQLRRALGGMLILALLLMVIPALCGRHTQDLALVYGSHTAAFVLLAVAIACVLRRSTIDK
ncbi:MAG: DUF2029 domain-containing protein, partial [Gemmataceae bacterium]|nr:DUF2029 domain-containing protein [Gemmataceae bacterium]